MLDRYFFTYHNPAGNRFLRGRGSFPAVRAIDIPLPGVPRWAVGYAMETAIWHVVLEDGGLVVIEAAADGNAEILAQQPRWFVGAQPPLVGVSLVEGTYVFRSDDSISVLSHPLPANDFETVAIDSKGDLVLSREEGVVARMPVRAPLDSRLVMNRRGQFALYANASSRYSHGLLGDAIEGCALLIFEVRDSEIQLLSRVDLPGADVFEGLAPFWADIDGDGREDLVCTVSNASLGTRLRVLLWDGRRVRQELDGPPTGQSYRWQHALSAGAFAPDGGIEIASMSSPHSGSRLEFYARAGAALERRASLPGFTSHRAGSRNLDQAAAGDFNGDGVPEVLVMGSSRQEIAAVQRGEGGAGEIWRLEAGGDITSNFAPVELLDGQLALAVGTASGVLRIWMPQG